MADSDKERNLITAKDLVLIYLDERRQYLVQIGSGLRLSSDLGDLDLKEIMGKPFGYVGRTHLGKKFYCLKPSTADIMMRVKRTTTIVYPKDLGYLLLETTVGPGSRVIEVGTGSGALTIVLAKLIASGGVVYSYDRREDFIDNAKKNVERAGYSDCVEFFCVDVSKDGFLQEDADAIFIDVPEPWDIVPKASVALKGGHHLVSWSPNIEQVKQTVATLEEHNFIRVKVSEVLVRDMLVRAQGVRPRERGITHTAYLIRAQKALAEH